MIKFISQKINPEYAKEKVKNKYPFLYDGQEPDVEKVKLFSHLMKNNIWLSMDDDSPISFNENGQLMNGLHRLLAIIDSGVEITETIAIGVPSFIIEHHGQECKDGTNEIIWNCSEFILDYVGVKTRNNSLIRKVYDTIYNRLKDYVSEIEFPNKRITSALYIAILCAEDSAISKNEIIDRMSDLKLAIWIPNDFFVYAYKILANIKSEFIRPPIYNFLPIDIYEAVMRHG